ncbi:polysaccharide biosynthesis/export family protein [Flavobacteriales bacterium]|nr:polysaccharide biosynthesis/export family protein [Flavobacteriales bacterium]
MNILVLRNFCLFILVNIILASCSSNSQLVYLNDSVNDNFYKVDYSAFNNNIETGDILKIDIQTIIPEAALPYNTYVNKNAGANLSLLNIDGYVVNENKIINYPTLGNISVENLSENKLAERIKKLLVDGEHLTNPHVKVRRVNSKFTVLGEVRIPGTFSYYDRNLNIFQALGYAGDITISGKRKNITLIREENGMRKVYDISLSKSELLNKPYYLIKNNDIIMVKPNFSKVKSAGFIGSPASIASVASLLLSITLLILNK